MEIHSTSPEQTQQIAQDLAKSFTGGEVVALFGDLGAGKTVFVKGIAIGLGIKKRILSPTFIFVRSYPSTINHKPLTFHHVDLFRTKPSDLTTLGLAEIFGPDSVVAIEWSEKIEKFLPKKRIDVVIRSIDEKTRQITITSYSLSFASPLSSPPSRLSFPRSHLSFPRKRESINITKAAQVLKKGGIVVFPTDTVYGIGCRWDFPKSVARIYQIKGTPKTQAFPILVSSVEQAKKIVKISPTAQKLIDKYWAGALTIVLSSRHGISKIGLRMPDSDLVQNLIKKTGVPIIGTSANIHGRNAVKSSKDLDPELTKQIDYLIEGECEGGVESTVIDATVNPPKILRLGAVKL